MARSSKPKNKSKSPKTNSASPQLDINPEVIENLEQALTEVKPEISEQAELIAKKLPHIKSKITQIQLIHYLNFFLFKDAVSVIYKPLIAAYAELYGLKANLDDEQELKTWFDTNLSSIFNAEEIQKSTSYQWLLSYLTLGEIFLASPNFMQKLEQYYTVRTFEECLQVITNSIPYYTEFLNSIIDNLDKELNDQYYTKTATKISQDMEIIVKTKEQAHLDFPEVNRYVIANNEYEKASTLIQVIRYVFKNAQ